MFHYVHLGPVRCSDLIWNQAASQGLHHFRRNSREFFFSQLPWGQICWLEHAIRVWLLPSSVVFLSKPCQCNPWSYWLGSSKDFSALSWISALPWSFVSRSFSTSPYGFLPWGTWSGCTVWAGFPGSMSRPRAGTFTAFLQIQTATLQWSLLTSSYSSLDCSLPKGLCPLEIL